MKLCITLLVSTALTLAHAATGVANQEVINTRLGELTFTHDFINGYPTTETQQRLFDEIDFQRACQAYLWSIPIVAMAQWQWSHENELGAKNGQIVYAESYEDKLGGLTYNTTTPYALPFINLQDGPWVTVMPEGKVRGAANSFWQIGIVQMTKPGKYLFIGPGQEVPNKAEAEGYTVVQMPTMNLLLGIRLMSKDKGQNTGPR